jgi:hypothetical protein
MSERLTDPHKAVDYIIRSAPKYAKAKAERVYLEEFRKSKKALLMKAADQDRLSLAGQERDAYSHPEYVALLEGLKVAVEIEEKLRWDLIAAQARVEIWRTESANNRATDRATQ